MDDSTPRGKIWNSYTMKHHRLRFSLFMPHHFHHVPDFNYGKRYPNETEIRNSIEREVVNCDKKTVLISPLDSLDAEYNFLSNNYPYKKFYKGRDTLVGARGFIIGMTFTIDGKMSKVPKYFQYLIDTGIYGRIVQELSDRKFSSRKPAVRNDLEGVTAFGLDGTIVTIFILSGTCVILALCVALRDRRWRFWWR